MASGLSKKDLLEKLFGRGSPIVTAVAPGRVNLIGEHTDYNDGFVLPMAIGLKVEAAARLRNDQTVIIHAADVDQSVTFSLEQPIVRDPAHPWSDYCRGVIHVLREAGISLRGMEMVFSGDIPLGAGLSSSAALEVATAMVLRKLNGFTMDGLTLARHCQRAENVFVGMNCGIMDQFVSVSGKAGHAVFLDCRSLEFRLVPLDLAGHRILICHSGVKHELVGSEYNQRRLQCEAGVEVLRRHAPGIRALRDANLELVEAHAEEMTPEVHRRCRHVVTEDARVEESVAALQKGQLARFGQLMNASHDSLQHDFEVSCPEIDLLVELARKVPGVLGARITGGGFGGCTVNLIEERAVQSFEEKVLAEYRRRTSKEARLFIGVPADGARIL